MPDDPIIVQAVEPDPLQVEADSTEEFIVNLDQTGPTGKSAYQLAVDLGFVGTEAEWLASLKGTTGIPVIPSDANLNDYITPGIYQLVDPTVGGQVAHDTTLVDPLWNGTFWGQWATLTVTTGGSNGWGVVFQTISYVEFTEDGIVHIARSTYDPSDSWGTFAKIFPATPASRQLLATNTTTDVVPNKSNIGDLWVNANTNAKTFNFGAFGGTNLEGLSLDVSFVTNGGKFTFTAVTGVTLVVPTGKVSACSAGVVRAVGRMTGVGPGGTVYLSGDLDSA